MGRERPDMFDVACGDCALYDFLLTRFDPIDLKTKINIAASCVLQEMLAPRPHEEEAFPESIPEDEPDPAPVADRPSIGLEIADIRDRNIGQRPPEISVQDRFQRGPAEVDFELEALSEPTEDLAPSDQDEVKLAGNRPAVRPKTGVGTDWESLIQGFQAAAQRYQSETPGMSDTGDEDA